METKKRLGQFFTTNYEKILNGFEIPENINKIIEPFVGNGDLLKFIKNDILTEIYDIEPKIENVIKQDTLINPPNFENSFVITNPPYLARNKNNNKELYNLFDTNDLYKCFIKILILNRPIGGILILPLNFFCSIRKKDIELRKDFLKSFSISKINIFEDKIFEDTDYTICSFQFSKKKRNIETEIIFFPSNKNIKIDLNNQFNFLIGGNIYNLEKSNYKISRFEPNTNISIKCIDDKKLINMFMSDKIFIDNTENQSNRSYISLNIKPKISIEIQKQLCDEFNLFLNTERNKYNSLFLCNYRNNFRKRISFNLIYSVVSFLLRKFEIQKLNQ